MTHGDFYTIDLKMGNQSLEMPTSSLSFSMHDSIYSFFSNAAFKMKDVTGMLREQLLPVEGNLFTLVFGNDKGTLEAPFVVIEDDSDKNRSMGVLNGDLNVQMLHAFYDKEAILSKAYQGQTTNVLTKVLGEYGFRAINKNDASSNLIWYRMNQTQSKFITEVLVPNSFSYNSNNTPFYAFIGVDNSFNFRHFESMWNSTPVATLRYTLSSAEEFDRDNILDIKPFRTGSSKIKKFRKRTVFSRNLETGEYERRFDHLKEYPLQKDNELYVPLIDTEKTVTDFIDTSFEYPTGGDKEAYKARIIYSEREGMILERFMITVPFNPILISGKTVNVELSLPDSESGMVTSSYTSGKYLIEDSLHSWYGDTAKRGVTTIIVGRKFAYVPKDYTLRQKMEKA